MPDVVTIDVVTGQDLISHSGVGVPQRWWRFAALCLVYEFGSSFMSLVHRKEVEMMRSIPDNLGHKLFLFCHVRYPLRGQRSAWNHSPWQGFILEKKGPQWCVQTGGRNGLAPVTQKFLQQLLQIQVFIAAWLSKTWHPRAESCSGMTAEIWQRHSGRLLRFTENECHEAYP